MVPIDVTIFVEDCEKKKCSRDKNLVEASEFFLSLKNLLFRRTSRVEGSKATSATRV